jgi:superfamily I DNA/RNA helicase
MPTIVWSKPPYKLDASLKKKAYTFLEKLGVDDTTPGLHVEPISNSADPKVRTGRVDDSFRAVLFKLPGQIYVFHGIWAHDEAIAIAKTARLRTNPVTGVTEITVVAAPLPDVMHPAPGSASAAPSPSPAPASAGPGERMSLLAAHGIGREVLTGELGIDGALADRALAATDDDELMAAVSGEPDWQGLALFDLASGVSVEDVRKSLGLTAPESPAASSASSKGDTRPESEDERIVAGLRHPAALMSFVWIENNAELRQVIEDGDFGAWRVFLHPEQRKYATKTYNGPFRLSGGAGTGKTVVLLHRARTLARRSPATRVILTTYTKNLADQLDTDLNRLDSGLRRASGLGDSGILVSGIDSLASTVLRRAGASIATDAETVFGSATDRVHERTPASAWQDALDAAGPALPDSLRSPQFLAAEYTQIVLPGQLTSRADYFRARRPGRGVALNRAKRAAVWDAMEAYRAQARINGTIDFAEAASIAAAHLERVSSPDDARSFAADHVLVDEGQDLGPSHWQLLRALARPGRDDLLIAEDSYQRIYGQRIKLSSFGIKIVGRSQRLTLNYRTTAQNLAYAVTVLQGGSYVDLEGETESAAGYRSARGGPAPQLISCATLTEELDRTAELIQSWADEADVAPETIAVLVREQRLRDRVVTGLSERGVTIRAVDREQVKPGRPVVMTMHRAKGTEFSKVLLFGVDKAAVPRPMRDEEYAEEALSDALLRERSLLYVAATRARDELALSWNGEPSELLPDA